jgi:hypothetical protein
MEDTPERRLTINIANVAGRQKCQASKFRMTRACVGISGDASRNGTHRNRLPAGSLVRPDIKPSRMKVFIPGYSMRRLRSRSDSAVLGKRGSIAGDVEHGRVKKLEKKPKSSGLTPDPQWLKPENGLVIGRAIR